MTIVGGIWVCLSVPLSIFGAGSPEGREGLKWGVERLQKGLGLAQSSSLGLTSGAHNLPMPLDSFARLAEHINGLPLSAGASRIVGIDGCGGAGKSTFAEALSAELGGCSTVHTDDFAFWDQPLDWWPRLLDQVLMPLSRSEPARYQRYDWDAKELADWLSVESETVIIEGVSSTRREFRPFLAYRVWIETPAELRLKRGLERDGTAMKGQWLRWMADEDRYMADHLPREAAHLILDGSAPLEEGKFKLLQ
jgi:hypothetical protein